MSRNVPRSFARKGFRVPISHVDLPIAIQAQLLQQAVVNRELRRLLSPHQMLSFGCIPIARQDRITIVACYPDINPACLDVLREHLGGPVQGLAFHRRVIQANLQELLEHHRAPVNLPTFRGADFLHDTTQREVLLQEKIETGLEGVNRLPDSDLLLIDLRYQSTLTNLDWDESQSSLRIRDLHVPFRIRGDRVEVFDKRLLRSDGILAVRKQVSNLGANRGSRLEAVVGTDLPIPLHPSEIQIVGVEEDGTLLVHVYDRTVSVPLAAPEPLACTYHYLSEGNRYRRELHLAFAGIRRVAKADCVYIPQEMWGDDQDLDEWFELGPASLS